MGRFLGLVQRWRCWWWGHPVAAIGIDKDRRLSIWCPRCGRVWAGTGQDIVEVF